MLDVLKNMAAGRDSRGNPSMTLVTCMLIVIVATVLLALGGNTYPWIGKLAELSGLEYAAILTATGISWTAREAVAKKAGQ